MTRGGGAGTFRRCGGYLGPAAPATPRRGGGSGFDDRAAVHQPDDPVRAARQIEVVGGDDERHSALGLEPRNSSKTSSLVLGSRFPVGSSARTMAGRPTSARARATRCCSPRTAPRPVAGPLEEPDLAERVHGQPARLLRRTALDERREHRVLEGGEVREEVVELEDEAPSSRRNRVSSASDRAKRSSPRNQTDPAVGRSSAPRTWRSVDLPMPDAPTTATSSASCTVRLTPFSTRRGSALVRYSFSTPWATRSGARSPGGGESTS